METGIFSETGEKPRQRVGELVGHEEKIEAKGAD